MQSRLGAVLIVGLGALALRVNGETAPCASVLEAGKFRRGEAKSAEIKRCEEDSEATTTTTTTTPPVNCACCNRFRGPPSESQPHFFSFPRGNCGNFVDALQDDNYAYVTLTCNVVGQSYTYNYKYYAYDTTDGRLKCYTVESADLLDSEAERPPYYNTELKQCTVWDDTQDGCGFD